MIDETNGIIGWPIVQQYRERAWGDYARIAELRQSTDHWHDTAQMLKRQRDIAEEERDGWKIRAMKAEQGRQVNRDLLIIAEGQRDQAKIDAEHWKGEWAVVMGQLGGARAEVEAVTKRAEAAEAERDALRKVVADVRAIKKIDSPCRDGENNDWVDGWQYGYQSALEDVRECIIVASPALAVQPTTGEGV